MSIVGSLGSLGANRDLGANPEQTLENELLRSALKASGALKGMSSGKGGWAEMAADVFADVVATAITESSAARAAQSQATPEEGAVQALGIARQSRPAQVPVEPALRQAALGIHRRHGTGGHAGGHAGRVPESVLDLVDGAARISSHYGTRTDPLSHQHRHHDGVDIAAAEGTAIRAAADGVVSFVGQKGGYGNLVEIRHADGSRSRYAHARALLVKKGQQVQAGSVIAEVGSSGRSTGPHLHFEVREGRAAIDPTRALKTYQQRVDGESERTLPTGGPHG